jgi:hypothetical protein
MKLPEGSKVTEAQVLRRFARNIRHAATYRDGRTGWPNFGYRQAWINAWQRIREIEARTP